jgi:hypothetical protein
MIQLARSIEKELCELMDLREEVKRAEAVAAERLRSPGQNSKDDLHKAAR